MSIESAKRELREVFTEDPLIYIALQSLVADVIRDRLRYADLDSVEEINKLAKEIIDTMIERDQ